MKKILVAGVLALVSNYTLAAEGGYISGDFGVGIPTADDISIGASTISFDPGFAFNAAVGNEFANNFRAEIEIGYQQNNMTASNSLGNSAAIRMSTITVLANGYYAFNNDSNFVPFIGGGIGYGALTNELTLATHAFAYQFGGGLDYFVTDKFSVGAKYMFRGLVNNYDFVDNPESNNIYAGAKFYF